MSIDPKKIATLLGNQVRFIPSRTDNVHTLTNDRNPLNPQQATLKLENSDSYSNAKIPAACAPEGKVWILIDYDDHNDNGKLDDLSQFNLPETFTVDTPSGRHEWYEISEEQVSKLTKHRYVIPMFKNTEIFIGHKDIDHFFVAPGSIKNDKEYELHGELTPATLPDMMLQTLLAQARAESQEIIELVENQRVSFNADTDAPQNRRDYFQYLYQQSMPYEMGELEPLGLREGIGRDNTLYGYAVHGFTYNLSFDTVKEMLTTKVVHNEKMFFDPGDEFGEEAMDRIVGSALKGVTEARRNNERASNEDLMPYEWNEFGSRVVTYKQHVKKVLYLNKYSNNLICTNDNLRKLLCETIVYDRKSGMFLVARIKSYKQYEKMYERQMRDEMNKKIIDLDGILDLYSDTMLHWDRMTERQLNQEFNYHDKRKKVITNWIEFNIFKFSCNVYTQTLDENILIDGDSFFLLDRSPIQPLEKITKKEEAKVTKLIDTHMARIVDPNHHEKESTWLLDRYAYLLQNQSERSENILIIKGPQGTGKTSFITIMHHLFPNSKAIQYTDIKVMLDNFTEYRHMTHLDDINITKNGDDIENKIKSMTTSSQVTREVKYEQRTVSFGSINLSMTTNNEIDVNEFLTGRRFTILENNVPISIDEVARSVHSTLLEFKKDNFHLYKVLATMLMNREIPYFRSNFKTAAQKKQQAISNKGNKFGIALANMIANYGYISPTCQPIRPGENFNRSDFVTALFHHWYKLESNPNEVVEPKKLQKPKDAKINSYFAPDKRKSENIKHVFKELFPDPETQMSSLIGPSIGQSWCTHAPEIKDWFKLLAYVVVGESDQDSVDYVITKYDLEDQYYWDGKKPSIENLGTINVFENMDDEYDDDDQMSSLDQI